MSVVQLAELTWFRPPSRSFVLARARRTAAAGTITHLVVPGRVERRLSQASGRGIGEVWELPSQPVPGGLRTFSAPGAIRFLLMRLQPARVEIADPYLLGWLVPWLRQRGITTAAVATAPPPGAPTNRLLALPVTRRLALMFDEVVAPDAMTAAWFPVATIDTSWRPWARAAAVDLGAPTVANQMFTATSPSRRRDPAVSP